MRYFRTVGNHIILVRVPVLHNIILVFWVPEINTTELRRAAHRAFKLLHEYLTLRSVFEQVNKPVKSCAQE